ncbi:MAG: GAF domain-containing protein [Flavobacteriia bacterium]|nr:GAF domain-containing protein [Flavobacteriia bacterium]
MAEEILIVGSKEEKYKQLITQISALVGEEKDLISILSNVTAALKQGFSFFWVGFYLNKQNELILGPFQGSVACFRIPFGKGVCGTAYSEKKTLLVENVDEFPGHIACSSFSKSEIVVPIIKNNKVAAVLDIDSEKLADFDEIDQKYLENLCQWLSIYF